MIDTTDILLKAAEDVSPGLWCKGNMFREKAAGGGPISIAAFPGEGDFTLDRALAAKRCAVGSVAVATALLGGTEEDYLATLERVATWLDDDLLPQEKLSAEQKVIIFNDEVLPDDPVDAGTQLADLFRRAAEGLW